MSKETRPERGRGRFLTHEQPIIITGGSVALKFDSPHEEHFSPDDPDNPRSYRGSGLTITGVELYVPGRTPRLIEIPPGGCLVSMFGKRDTKPNDDPITIENREEDLIDIGLDSKEYEKQKTGSTFKWHHSSSHKVRRVEITFPPGGPEPFMEIIPGNGRCVIRIVYAHN